MVGIAWLAAVLAISLTMYAAIIDRRRDFGIMKALGVGSAGLAGAVVVEALIICALSFPIALLLARVASLVIEAVNPTYRVLPWHSSVVLRGAAAVVAAALIGALVPIRRIRALEPDLVLRS